MSIEVTIKMKSPIYVKGFEIIDNDPYFVKTVLVYPTENNIDKDVIMYTDIENAEDISNAVQYIADDGEDVTNTYKFSSIEEYLKPEIIKMHDDILVAGNKINTSWSLEHPTFYINVLIETENKNYQIEKNGKRYYTTTVCVIGNKADNVSVSELIIPNIKDYDLEKLTKTAIKEYNKLTNNVKKKLFKTKELNPITEEERQFIKYRLSERLQEFE